MKQDLAQYWKQTVGKLFLLEDNPKGCLLIPIWELKTAEQFSSLKATLKETNDRQMRK